MFQERVVFTRGGSSGGRAGGWPRRRWCSRGVREKARESHDCQGMGNRRSRGVPWLTQRAPYTRQGIGFKVTRMPLTSSTPSNPPGNWFSEACKCNAPGCPPAPPGNWLLQMQQTAEREVPPPDGALRRIITLVPTRERALHACRGIAGGGWSGAATLTCPPHLPGHCSCPEKTRLHVLTLAVTALLTWGQKEKKQPHETKKSPPRGPCRAGSLGSDKWVSSRRPSEIRVVFPRLSRGGLS